MTDLSDRISRLTPLQKATYALKEKSTRLEALERAQSEPIAIIGIGCRFPGGADDPESYWRMLRDGMDAINEVPKDRWDVDAYYDPDSQAPGKMNTRYGGFISQVDRFDNAFFGIPEREARGIDPQQRLLLELAWEALEDAGLPPASLRGSQTGVFIGICGSDYGLLLSSDLRITDAYVGTGTSLSIAANRISFTFDFHGPSIAVDAACSSSLVATHLACRSLRSGEADIALAGGVNLILSPTYAINLTKAGFSTPDGRVRTFDAKASGYVRGEGGGVVVLKPLSKALADGDPVYATICGSAINQDGFSNGLTAPNRQAQEAVLKSAYQQAQILPTGVHFIECHGTGTLLGDTIEAQALGNVVGLGRSDGDPCLLGAVKTNMGHLEAAAGVASLIKAALALKHKQIPPNLHFHKANPNIPFRELSLQVATELTPWPARRNGAIAGVSGFGFGGANAHIVLKQAPMPEEAVASQNATEHEPYILPLSARDEAALKSLTVAYRDRLEHNTQSFADLCYSVCLRREHHDHRLAILAHTTTEAAQLLEAHIAGQTASELFQGHKPYGREPRTVFVFTDELDTWRDIAPRMYAELQLFRQRLEEWDACLAELGGPAPVTMLEDPSAFTTPAIADSLLLALQTSLAETWKAFGVAPNAVIGLGRGELAAAYLAGSLRAEEAAGIAVFRTRQQQGKPNEASLAAIRPRSAAIPFVSCSRGEVRPGRLLDLDHWQQAPGDLPPVSVALEALQDRLPDCFLELGPASLASEMAAVLARTNPHTRVMAAIDGDRPDLTRELAMLYTLGHSIDWAQHYAEPRSFVALPKYPWQRHRYWIEVKGQKFQTISTQPKEEATGSRPTVSSNNQPSNTASSTQRSRPEIATPYEAPRTELEQLIGAMWQEHLRLDRVGVYDNFFDLGGDSLHAARMVNELQKRLEVTVHILAIFEAQNINDLAGYLRSHYPAAVRHLCPTEIVGSGEYNDPAWPEVITDSEVKKARSLVENYVPCKAAVPHPEHKNRRAIFVLSPPRSGSTLFRVMLAGHPQLFAPPELELLPFNTLAERRAAYEGLPSSWLDGTTRTLMDVYGLANDAAEERMRQYEEEGMSVSEFYRLIQARIDNRTLVDKTPRYGSQLQILERAEVLFDNPIYIHLLRHPCGMIQSFLDYKMDQMYTVRYNLKQKSPYSPQQIGELVWIIIQQNILKFLAGVPSERQYRLHFEDLVRYPERELRTLCDFLGLAYYETMADPYRDKEKRMTDAVHKEGRMHGDQNFLVKHRNIDPSVADRWMQLMSSDILGDPARRIAAELGYTDLQEPVATATEIALMSSAIDQEPESAEQLLGQLDELSDEDVDAMLSKMLAAQETSHG